MSNLVFDESSSNREASHGYAWWFSGDTFEKAMAEDRKPRKRGLTRRLVNHPGRLTIFYFLTLAALSTTLLMTPIATPKDETTTFTTAFFTAVSAISTCGISIVNSTTHWTTFGQGVLIFAVQMGGLGVMTFASLIALAVNHHLKATQRMLTANELGTTKLGEIKGVLTVVITTAFVIEGITFVALFPGLYKVNHGNVRHTLWESLFFAVMAYNNAGFTPRRRRSACQQLGGRPADPSQCFLRNPWLPGIAEPDAFLAYASSSEALEPAHQAHTDHHVLHCDRLVHVVPAGGMEQQAAVRRKRHRAAPLARHGRGSHATKLRI